MPMNKAGEQRDRVENSNVSNDKFDEALSAFVDGECDELEARRLVKHLLDDEQSRRQYARLQMVSDAFHDEVTESVPLDFASRISVAIDQEAPLNVASIAGASSNSDSSTSVQPLGTKPWAKVAVAASVTVAVLLGLQLRGPAAPGSSPVAAQLAAQDSVMTSIAPEASSPMLLDSKQAPLRVVGLDGQVSTPSSSPNNIVVQARLDQYMRRHAEHAALNSNTGLMPFARVASLPVEE